MWHFSWTAYIHYKGFRYIVWIFPNFPLSLENCFLLKKFMSPLNDRWVPVDDKLFITCFYSLWDRYVYVCILWYWINFVCTGICVSSLLIDTEGIVPLYNVFFLVLPILMNIFIFFSSSRFDINSGRQKKQKWLVKSNW